MAGLRLKVFVLLRPLINGPEVELRDDDDDAKS